MLNFRKSIGLFPIQVLSELKSLGESTQRFKVKDNVAARILQTELKGEEAAK